MLSSSTAESLGYILRDAALISDAQLKVALQDQHLSNDLQLGEIFVLRGWLKQKTTNFFAQEWHRLLNVSEKERLGYYLQSAGLLNEEQIDIILGEQKRLKYRFGKIAVLKGWVKPQTIDFFVENIASQGKLYPPFLDKSSLSNSFEKIDLLMTEALITIPLISSSTQSQKEWDKTQFLKDQYFSEEGHLFMTEVSITIPPRTVLTKLEK